jgi:hypothetical protein
MPSLEVDECYDDVMKAICIILHIQNDIFVWNQELVKYLTHNFSFTTNIRTLKLKKYVRGNHLNYFLDEDNKRYDLLIDIGTSVKYYSNYGKMNKYEFCDMFSINYSDDDMKIKKYIMDNTKNLLEIYHKHLFSNNTIAVLFNYHDINEKFACSIYIFDDFKFNYELKYDKLKYTRTLKEWNISNTLKYNDITIGNFIIGKNVEFGYNLNKYINILNRLDRV